MGAPKQQQQPNTAQRVERFFKIHPEIDAQDRALIRQEVGQMAQYYTLGWVKMAKVPNADRRCTAWANFKIREFSNLEPITRRELAHLINAIAHSVCSTGRY